MKKLKVKRCFYEKMPHSRTFENLYGETSQGLVLLQTNVRKRSFMYEHWLKFYTDKKISVKFRVYTWELTKKGYRLTVGMDRVGVSNRTSYPSILKCTENFLASRKHQFYYDLENTKKRYNQLKKEKKFYDGKISLEVTPY